VLLPAVLAPIIAGLIALIATYLAYRITARAAKDTVTKGFKLGQIVSGSMVALAHGTNDAQKTMGIITLTLITAGALPADAGPPFWVILSSGLAIALGTYAGGWRIIQTLGMRVSDLRDAAGASPPGPAPPRSSSPPHTSASRCPPRRSPPARSSAPGRLAGPRPCAGASAGRSPSRGC
jgi:phosphate/sulfate permease